MEEKQFLECTTLQTLLDSIKGKLVYVPHTATIEETLRVMSHHAISAVPVVLASELPHSDTCFHCSDGMSSPSNCNNPNDVNDDPCFHCNDAIAPPCSYLGIASTFDIFGYLAELLRKTTDASTATRLFFTTPIHRCIKSHTLCIMRPNSSVLDAMDKMIDGMCQGLVPCIVHKRARHDEEKKIFTGYSMITQTDIVGFIQARSDKFQPILRQSVESLQAYQSEVYGFLGDVPLVDAIRCMHEASLTTVPVLEVDETVKRKELIHATGKIIVGAFSACDLRRCPADALSKWAQEGLLRFLKRANVMEKSCSVNALEADPTAMHHVDLIGNYARFQLASCTVESSLEDVIRAALQDDVGRVWVVEKDCVLLGLITLNDILRVIKRSIFEEHRRCF